MSSKVHCIKTQADYLYTLTHHSVFVKNFKQQLVVAVVDLFKKEKIKSIVKETRFSVRFSPLIESLLKDNHHKVGRVLTSVQQMPGQYSYFEGPDGYPFRSQGNLFQTPQVRRSL